MNRKLKVLLLAAMAVTAVSAFSVASAQAFTKFKNPEGGNTVIVSTPDGTVSKEHHHVFVTEAGTLTCSTAEFKGTISVATTASQELSIVSYKNCDFQGVGATVTPNGCTYVLNAGGSFQIKCPTSKVIEVTAGSCVIKVGEQSSLSGLGYASINTSKEITFTMSVKAITYSAAGCASGNGNSKNNGEYTTGNTILTGEEDVGGSGNGTMKPISME
jgi:hypothetical protein